MKDTMTITEVSAAYGVSARMIRYYESLGLLGSDRRAGYAWRVYGAEEIRRLRQILVLRKLRLPLKDIGEILDDAGSDTAIALFEKYLAEIDGEFKALHGVWRVIAEFCGALKRNPAQPAGETLLQDAQLLALADVLSPASKPIQKEKDIVIDKLKQDEDADRVISDVRIVRLPSSDVAAAYVVGCNAKHRAGIMIADFVRSARLWDRHPGLRLYGFGHSIPENSGDWHGYEYWVTIPDGMTVPALLERKHFAGGTYAAHMKRVDKFGEWSRLDMWIKNNDEYEAAGIGDPSIMFGALEEHLNYHDHIQETESGEPVPTQCDLLYPIQRKKK